MRRASVVLLVVLTACVPSERDAERPARVPTAVAAAQPGGTLRVAITPPDGLDPTGAHEPSGELIARTMCDQLVALDPVTGEPRPSLAASWTVGDGGRNVFVKLRSDARFSDGTPVTAEDVQFSLSRLANERFASPSASLLEDVGGYGFVHGEIDIDDETLRRTLYGVGIVNSSTLSITLEDPRSDFFRVLAHPATTPVPRKLVERDGATFARAPVCAGPYKLAAEPQPGAPIRLVRTPGYAGGNATMTRGGAGYADAIEFHLFGSRARAVAAFRRGVVDVAPLPEEDRRAAPSGARVVTQPGLQTEFVGFPTTKPPFDDRRVRAALSLALDRTAIARTVFSDRRVPATAFLPEVLDAGAPPTGCSANVRATADVNGARTLLRAAGIDPASLRPTFAFNDEFGNRALVAEIVRQWRAGLGVRAQPQPMPWERYRSQATRPQGLEGLFRFGWAPVVPSVEQIVGPLFTVNGIGKDNWSLYSSRDLNDALRDFNEAAATPDRQREARRAHEILCDDMPMIPLLRASRAFLVRDTLASAVTAETSAAHAEPLLRELFLR